MDYKIRKIEPGELEDALSLVLKTFMEFEAPEYSDEGVETFKKDIIHSEAFKAACIKGENRIWGAFDQKKLIGLIGMRGESHICLVFTHKDYHRQGVATAIFNTLIEELRMSSPNLTKITLNSSPYGLPFYHKTGFVDTDVQQTKNGIIYTPMEYVVK